MSYPGHVRSLHLSERRASLTDHVNGRDIQPPDRPRKRRYTGPSSVDNGSLESGSNYFSPGEVLDNVCDDRGNEARPSLWVGNISRGVSEHEVKAVFGFGDPDTKIQSIRIQNKNQESYIFVNYWEIEDAVQALYQYHERDAFNRGRPVYIRFAKSQEEAVKEKIETSKVTINSDARKKGNAPPTGPRAMRRSVSPPAPRKPSNSHRRSEHSSQEKSARSYKRKRSRDQFAYENCYRPTYREDDDHEYRSLRQNGRRSLDNRDKADDARTKLDTPIEQALNQQNSKLETSVGTQIDENRQNGLRARKLSMESVAQSAVVDLDGMDFSFQLSDKPLNLAHQGNAEITIKGAATRDWSHRQDAKAEDYEGTATDQQPFDHLVRLFEANEQAELLKIRNRLLKPPSNQVRTATEETVSVLSDITSSSQPSSIRKKLCAKCDKPETTLLSLSLKCSHCPRKFHSACVNLSRSSAEDGSFVCTRCVRKGKAKPTNLTLIAPSASTTEEPSTTIFNNQQNSLELELRNEDATTVPQPSINSVPYSNQTDTHSAPLEDEIEGSEYSPKLDPTSPASDDNRGLEMGNVMTLPANAIEMNNIKLHEDAKAMIEKYKRLVTCSHWEKGGCWRNEGKDCMFAHTYTNIGSPRCQRSCKSWTCYHWRSQGVCRQRNCIHAHHDTGLYVGFDGWASKKHLTCPFYYNRGHCKKADEECPYAHQDTGFLAPEPKGFVSKPTGELNEMPATNSNQQNSTPDHQNLRVDMKIPPYHQGDNATSTDLPSSLSNLDTTRDCNRLDKTIPFADVFTSTFTNNTILRPQLQLKIREIKNLVSQFQVCSNSIDDLQQLNDLDNKRSAELTHDPRKPRADVVSPQMNLLSSVQTLVPEPNHQLNRLSDMITIETEQSTSKQFSMRECKICGKKVLKSNICVNCKESKSPVRPNTPVKATSPNVSGWKAQEIVPFGNDAHNHIDDHLDSLISGEFDPPAPRDISPTKVLKRAASGSNMFLPNKRSRPSVTTAPAGIITEVRLYGTKLITDQPSIETLIKQAKGSKASENTSELEIDDPEATNTHSAAEPVIASNSTSPSKEPVPKDSINESMPKSNDHPPFQSSDPSLNQTSEPKEQLISNVCPTRLPSVGPLAPTHEKDQGTVGGHYTQSICSTPVIDAESELRKWIRNPAESTSPPQSRSSSISGDSDVPLAMLDARRSLTAASALIRHNESWKADSPPKRPCACAQRRRKCLHISKDQERLDPQKCYDWIIAERARGSEFKGRSKIELESIEESARRYADETFCTAEATHINSEDISGKQVDLDKRMPPEIDPLEKNKEHLKGASTSGSADSTEELFDRDLAPTDEETNPSTHSSPPTVCDQPKPVQSTVLMRLKQRGVEFEFSDEDSDGEEIPDFSTNHIGHRGPFLPSISKGQGLKNCLLLRERQMLRNQQINDNPHRETIHSHQKHLIRAKVQHKICHDNIERDQYLPDSIVIKDEEITFQEFLGIPHDISIEPCLLGQGITGILAFREKDKDHAQSIFDIAGMRNKRRVIDGQKWPLTER